MLALRRMPPWIHLPGCGLGKWWERLELTNSFFHWSPMGAGLPCFGEFYLLTILLLASQNTAHAASDRWGRWYSQAGSPLGGHLVHSWARSGHCTLLHPCALCPYWSSQSQKATSVVIPHTSWEGLLSLDPASAPSKGVLAACPYWTWCFIGRPSPLLLPAPLASALSPLHKCKLEWKLQKSGSLLCVLSPLDSDPWAPRLNLIP